MTSTERHGTKTFQTLKHGCMQETRGRNKPRSLQAGAANILAPSETIQTICRCRRRPLTCAPAALRNGCITHLYRDRRRPGSLVVELHKGAFGAFTLTAIRRSSTLVITTRRNPRKDSRNTVCFRWQNTIRERHHHSLLAVGRRFSSPELPPQASPQRVAS